LAAKLPQPVPLPPIEQRVDGFPLRDAFFLHARLRVDLHRRVDFGVPHQLLYHPDIVAGYGQ
jgi:hypothetical protein